MFVFFYVHLCAGGADEQHRAGAELQATNQQHPQPVQPAAFLEHVQQVWKYRDMQALTLIKDHKHNAIVSFSRRDLEMNRSGTVLNAKTLK